MPARRADRRGSAVDRGVGGAVRPAARAAPAARRGRDDASASASSAGGVRAGRDRHAADAVGARAGDVERRVADDGGALARPARRRRARGPRGQRRAVLAVGAEAALAARGRAADPRALELQPRDRLEVAGDQRELVTPPSRGAPRAAAAPPGATRGAGPPGSGARTRAQGAARPRVGALRRCAPASSRASARIDAAIARSVRPAAWTRRRRARRRRGPRRDAVVQRVARARRGAAAAACRRCRRAAAATAAPAPAREGRRPAPGAGRTRRSAAPRRARRRAGPSRPASACSAAGADTHRVGTPPRLKWTASASVPVRARRAPSTVNGDRLGLGGRRRAARRARGCSVEPRSITGPEPSACSPASLRVDARARRWRG